jgi:hypothetical protein
MQSITELFAKIPHTTFFNLDPALAWRGIHLLEALKVRVRNDHERITDAVAAELTIHHGERLTYQCLFDVPHDSDEECSIEAVALDGVALFIHHRVGDRSDYTDGIRVLNGPACAEILRKMAEAQLTEEFENLAIEQANDAPLTLESLLAKNQYLTYVSNGVFSIKSPRWCAHFRSVVSNYFVWHLTAPGLPVRVQSFVSWSSPNNRSLCTETARNTAVLTTDAGDIELDCRELLISAVDDFEAVLQAAKVVACPDAWLPEKARCADPRTLQFLVRITQHKKGRTQDAAGFIIFPSIELAQTFATEFAGPHPGVFDPLSEAVAKHLTSETTCKAPVSED